MVTLVIIISLGVKAYSQQDTYIRNSNLFPLKFNPAYTGDQSLNTVMLLTRQQWVGFEGAPKTYLLASHFSLPGYNAALGAEVESSSTGPAKETGLFISYSYKADLSDNSYIVFGLRGGASLFRISTDDLIVREPGDYLFQEGQRGKILPNIGAGIHYSGRFLYADISVPGILRNSLSPKPVGSRVKDNREDRLVIIGIGSFVPATNDISLEPSLMTWMVNGSPLLVDFRLSAAWQETAGASLNMRPGGAIGGGFWYIIRNDIKFGYSYELPLATPSGSKMGAHEVFWGYNLSFLKQKTSSPRRF